MSTRQAFLFAAIAAALFAASCARSNETRPDCGAGGTAVVHGTGRYCVYIVIQTGFECPAAMRYRHDFGPSAVCSDREMSDASLPEDVCRHIDDPRCGTDPTGPGPVIACDSARWPLDGERCDPVAYPLGRVCRADCVGGCMPSCECQSGVWRCNEDCRDFGGLFCGTAPVCTATAAGCVSRGDGGVGLAFPDGGMCGADGETGCGPFPRFLCCSGYCDRRAAEGVCVTSEAAHATTDAGSCLRDSIQGCTSGSECCSGRCEPLAGNPTGVCIPAG